MQLFTVSGVNHMDFSQLETMARLVSNNIRFPDRLRNSYLVPEGHGRPGDVVAVQVERVGAYPQQLTLNNKPVSIHESDVLIGVLGRRESGTSIAGDIPQQGIELQEGTYLDILSSSTIIGRARHVPEFLGTHATEVRFLGFLAEHSNPVNLKDITPYAWQDHYTGESPVVLALGSSAECGKTTLVGKLTQLFRQQGLAVAAIKTNGSGNVRDRASMMQAGADFVLDFPDIGLVTTYALPPQEYLRAAKGLFTEASKAGADVILAECGGDVMWGNVPALLADTEITRHVVGAVMASRDFMGAYGAFSYVRGLGFSAPIFFGTPIQTETFYRRPSFEALVGSRVFDIMDPAQGRELADRLAGNIRPTKLQIPEHAEPSFVTG